MKTIFFYLLFMIICKNYFAQNPSLRINLSKKIDSLVVEDQKWRNMLKNIRMGETDSSNLNYAKKMFDLTDSLNLYEIKKIFNSYGYPTISLVGEKSNHNFWLLVQHCDEDILFQKQILAEMEKFIKTKECNNIDYAYLLDRIRVQEGQEQFYGTQVELNPEETTFIPKKIFKPEEVEKRREEIGLPPLKDYLERMTNDFTKKQK